MEKTGVLRVSNDRVSRLENFRKLARANEVPPLQSATDFLAERGLDDGDNTKVTGSLGNLDDGTAVCFITAAVRVQALAGAFESAAKKRGARKAVAKKGGTKKKAAKKGGAKKGGAKKAAGKKAAGKKGAAGRSTKKTRKK
jgi:hypothetical protein